MDAYSVSLSSLKRQTPALGGGLKASTTTAGYLVFMPLPMVGSFSILRVI